MKEHSDSKNKFSIDGNLKMLEYLVDNIFLDFAGKVVRQTVGIPMRESQNQESTEECTHSSQNDDKFRKRIGLNKKNVYSP